MKLNNLMSYKLNENVDETVYNNAIKIVSKLKNAGHKDTFFVGGWVRDKLLGLDNAKDIDIATEAKPDQVKEVFKGEKFIEVGEAFNIVMVVLDGETFEIATFRGDGQYLDGRRPEEVFFTNAEEDAKRRDFTVNALFYDPMTDKYVDYVGGKQDLEKKLLRAIGEPLERFSEDYLRMLRAVRFAAQKGFRIENSTLQAIMAVAGNISKISKERIKAEMDKILMSDKPGDGLKLLKKTGLLQELFPEIAELLGIEQNPEFHPEGAIVEKL